MRLYDRLYDPEASVVLNPLSMLKVALEFEQFAAHSRYLRGKVDIQRVAVARLLTRVRFYSCSALKLQISNSL